MAYYHVTDAGADTKTGADWAHAMSQTEFEAFLEGGGTVAGDIYYIKGDILVDSAWVASVAGTAVAPISIIGVNPGCTNEGAAVVYTDWPAIGSGDRPLLTCGANAITFANYYKVFNLEITGTAAAMVTSGTYSTFYNCKFSQTYTSYRTAMTAGTYNTFVHCEFVAMDVATPRGRALAAATGCKVICCYIHDSAKAIGTLSSVVNVLFSIIDTCPIGIEFEAYYGIFVFNNTIYNSTTVAVSGTSGYGFVGINNIIDTSAVGFQWTTPTDANFFFKNCGLEGVGEVVDMWNGVAVAADGGCHYDPAWKNEDPDLDGADDFSLQSTSPCINNALSPTLGT